MPTPAEQFAMDHPFAPTGWAPARRVQPPPVNDQTQGRVLDLEMREKQLESRVAQLERMIKGATISAECNSEDSTITVTLNWGG